LEYTIVLPWLYSFILCFVVLNCSQINFHHIPPYLPPALVCGDGAGRELADKGAGEVEGVLAGDGNGGLGGVPVGDGDGEYVVGARRRGMEGTASYYETPVFELHASPFFASPCPRGGGATARDGRYSELL
jgi:hypothetical protein